MGMTAVKSVDPHSPARRAGVRAGETLTHINGHPIVDVLDYKFYSYDPRLEITQILSSRSKGRTGLSARCGYANPRVRTWGWSSRPI